MALLDDLRDFINLTHARAWEHAVSSGNVPHEPELIASFLDPRCQAQLQSVLQSHFGARKLNMQLTSVFTHQTPTVRPASAPNAVEIADLLLIRQHFARGPSNAATAGRALLLQAKKNVDPSSGNVGQGNPKIQFDLYQKWPAFEGVRRLPKSPPPAHAWNFNPRACTPKEYGHYLAVFDGHAFRVSPPNSLTASVNSASSFSTSKYPTPPAPATTWANGPVPLSAVAGKGVQCSTDFAKTLEDFVHGRCGESFTPGVLSGADHWDVFVNYMLNMAASGSYTLHLKRAWSGGPRARGNTVQAWRAALPYLFFELEDHWRQGFAALVEQARPDPLEVQLGLRRTPFMKDVRNFLLNALTWAPSRSPPDAAADELMPDGDGGHVPVLVLATSGDEMIEPMMNGPS